MTSENDQNSSGTIRVKSTDHRKATSICFFLQQYLLRKAEKAPKTTNRFERKTDSSARWFRARAKRHSMRLSSYRQWLLSNQRARNLTNVVKIQILLWNSQNL